MANDGVDFTARSGEIHALLGENGAGKSTLMSVLTGLYRPDEGEIYLRGKRVTLRSPREAINSGIGMVHQHFRLVHSLTVAENVILGLPTPRFHLRLGEIEKRIAEISEKYGLVVEPRARIWQLSVGEQQRVEILKMLYRGAEILILDEPTAVLTPQEARELYQTLRHMVGKGHAVVFITHKLQEVMHAADRITVLRNGRKVATLDKAGTDERELARMMVGREVFLQKEKSPAKLGEKILELREVRALSDKGRPALQGVCLQIRSGEILGIAGVAGNGQKELAEVITGLRRATAGKVLIDGKDMTNRSPGDIIGAGVGHIPEDRLGMGLVPTLDVADNVILKEYRNPPIARGPFLDTRRMVERGRQLVAEFDVKVPRMEAPVKLLSGGNLQRLLLAREISCKPKLIVAVLPTRGLDIGATEAVHRLLLEQRAAGRAVLLVSEDLDEVLGLSDRVAVIYEGRIMGVVSSDAAGVEEIGLMMAGAKSAKEA